MEDWDDLRYFLAVARNGSVTRAASKLGVNHSTVSRRIQAFEKKHNVRLFERIPTGYEMTQSAENIYPIALEIEQRSHEIERQMFGSDNRLQGKIVITAPNFIINELVMPHITEFRQNYSGIDLIFLTTADLKNMAAREADIAIRLTPQPPETLIGRQVASFSQGIYTSKAYWAQQKKQHEVILWNDEISLPQWTQSHFPDAKIAMRADTIATMVSAVKSGAGIAHMPCIMGEAQKELFRLKRELPPPAWGVWILNHVDLRSTARIRVTREFLTDVLLKYKNTFEGENSRYL